VQVLALGVAIVAGVAILVLFVGVGRMILSAESVEDRLQDLAPLPALPANHEGGQKGRKTSALASLASSFISWQAFSSSAQASLARANLKLTVGEYMLMHAACAGVLFLLAWVLSRQVPLAVLAAVPGLFLPRLYVRRRQRQRLVAFEQQLDDVLTLLVGSLRSGYGLSIAMAAVAKQMPPPASEEFARVVRGIALGASMTQALSNLVERISSDDLDMMVTAVSVQREVGGNLADILETISSTIRERVRLKGQLHALTVQSTMSRYVLTGLPVALGLIMYFLNPGYMANLFLPGPTLIIPVVAIVLLILGYFVMSKLSKIEM